MLGIHLKTGVEATLQRLNAHSKGRQLKNLKFVWGYDTAAISETSKGVTVYFPSIDEAKAVPDGLLYRLVGYACHELGHHWFTNHKAWDRAAQGDAWIHGLINGLEDPRIEAKVIKSGFAGNSRNLFTGLVNHVVGPELPTDFDNIPFILAVEGRRLNGYDILAKQTYTTTPWASDIEWALTEAHVAPDTGRITEIALELAKRLKNREDEKPEDGEDGEQGEDGDGGEGQDGQPGEPGEGKDGEPGEGNGEGNGNGNGNGNDEGNDEGGEQGGENGQPGDGKGQGEGGQPGDGTGQPGEDEGEGQGKGEGKGRSSDPTDWIQDELKEHQTKAQKDGVVGRIDPPTFYEFD